VGGAFLADGFGGHVGLEGCDVEIEPEVVIQVNGGAAGTSDGIDVLAHDRLAIGRSPSCRPSLTG
jgi:hypothetical protein